MMREHPDRLPDHAPVLVTDKRLNLGHRPVSDHTPACGSTAPLTLATALQAHGWSVLPCPDCWRGRRPW